MGILNCMERLAISKEVTYLGIEKNEVWHNIHKKLKSSVKEMPFPVRMKIIDDDVFTVINQIKFNRSKWKPNILILHYVISDMVKNGARMCTFINDIVDKIIPYMPFGSSIIINDINHNTAARNYFDDLARTTNEKYVIEVNKGHYVNSNRWTYPYGTQRPTNAITQTIPDGIAFKYSSWAFCSSAHMIINIISERSV